MKLAKVIMYATRLVALAIGTVAGCTGSDPAGNLTLGVGGFSVSSIADPVLGNAAVSSFTLMASQKNSAPETINVTVRAKHAVDARAAYFRVAFDPARFTLQHVEAGPGLRELSPQGQLLELYHLAAPGVVDCGQVLPSCMKKRGFSGEGVVASLTFTKHPACAVTRAVSTPPDTAASSAVLTISSATTKLSWRYYNQGDYNQDGKVGVTDLTPLGIHYGQSVSYPGELDTAKAVVDGNSDTQLNIGDLAPIGFNFGKRAFRWNMYRSLDAADYPASAGAGNGSATFVDYLLQTSYDGTTNPSVDRVAYYYTIAPMTANEHFWVRPSDEALLEGTPSNMVTYSTSNQPPNAAFASFGGSSGDGLTGIAAHYANFDASASSDPDGDTITYSWDCNGDSVADSTTVYAQFIYDTANVYTATLTVSDGTLTDTDSRTITVTDPGTWHVQTLAGAADDSGAYCSLAAVNGVPAIAYRSDDGMAVNLRYIDALDALGNTWNGATDIPTALNPLRIALAEVNGAPAVAYYETGTFTPAMAYTRYDSSIPAWNGPMSIDSDVDSGSYCSLMFFGTLPCVAFYQTDYTNGALRFAKALSTNGDSWQTAQIVDGSAGRITGHYASMANIMGLVGISYYDLTTTSLKYAVADDEPASTFSSYVACTISGEDVGQYCSLALIASRPAIAFVNTTTGHVLYKRAGDYFGRDWATATDDWAANAGQDLSLTAIAGQPAIAYRHIDGSLRYIRSGSPYGLIHITESIIDDVPGENVGYYVNLKEINGHPCVAYYNINSGDLKYAMQYP